jgi:hypothetical protein
MGLSLGAVERVAQRRAKGLIGAMGAQLDRARRGAEDLGGLAD